jgi:catechol 2,3-dioxygenase-like lactoylglutathione lyase family enzyme
MSVHHVEIWVADLAASEPRWDWLLGALGWKPYQNWPHGRSWRAAGDGPYVVIEQSPALRTDVPYDRMRAGLNHLALRTDRATVDAVAAEAAGHGWTLMFTDRHPHGGGADHYAAYLEEADGFEVELVAVEATG